MDDLSDIYNWRRFNERLTTSGQPSEAQFSHIQTLGVTHVINLAMHDHEHALPDQRATLTQLGMTYIHIPVVFDNPTQADFDQFCSAMAETHTAQLHVHCIANLRVTAFLYKYWKDLQGMDELQARQLMDSVWQPGGVWADFIGDRQSVKHRHRPPVGRESWPKFP